MVESLTRDQFLKIVERVLSRLERAADELARLDAAMGDGDFGVTVTLGSRGIRAQLPAVADQDIGTIVARSGMAFNGAAPSTFGALFAIGAMRAGKEARGAQTLDLPLLARMARAAEQGIMERGKAERGDKTLLDALGPSADALEKATAEGRPLSEGVAAAVAAARQGMEATIQMKSRSGRGSWIAERTVGHQDPGATAIHLIWQGMEDYLNAPEE